MTTDQAQRSIIAAALFPIKSPVALPSPYEQLLAAHYIEGHCTLAHALTLLEAHYHSSSSQTVGRTRTEAVD